MLIGVVRSGVVESRHPVAVAAVDASGRVVFCSGPYQETPFFMRSAAKPFQAAVSRRRGPALALEQLAVAAASHGGQPVHVALAEQMLAEVGFRPEHLLCPPAWPGSPSALRRVAAAGVSAPQPLFHNCSGKHAAMLRACAASGWPLSYTDPEHPLQREICAEIEASTGEPIRAVGVDGCGVPTFGVTVAGLARAFARLATDPEMAPLADAMFRFSALTSDGDRPEVELARWCPAVVKGGAQGCIGVAWFGGLGVGAKCWSGEELPAVVAVISALRHLGALSAYGMEMLSAVARPPVLGGGRPVGYLEVLEGEG
ncbi:MAG: asparaginase [Acidimicrobiia bacterium]|nr:asparaginase [Acidimicrobiia bacterium]